MLTIVILLSGPQRREWLNRALNSLPWQSAQLSEVHLIHQNGHGPWEDELKALAAKWSKAKLFCFDEHLHFAPNFNRGASAVNTPWMMLLPDDDFLINAEATNALKQIETMPPDKYAFVSYGWYYLKKGRYLRAKVRCYTPATAVNNTPKLCATLISTKAYKDLGGFDIKYGGFVDTVLFMQLAAKHGALFSNTPIGVYQLHDSQLSSSHESTYHPYLESAYQIISSYAPSGAERLKVRKNLEAFIHDRPQMLVKRFICKLTDKLRWKKGISQSQPPEQPATMAGKSRLFDYHSTSAYTRQAH